VTVDHNPEEFDELGVLGNSHLADVRFGAVDVRPAMSGGTFSEAMSKLPRAEVRLRERLARGLLIDYLAPVSARFGESKHFVGDVLSAVPDQNVIEIGLSSMPELEESTIGVLATWGVPHYEVLHVLTRTAGLTEQQLKIQHLETLPMELFEVVVPVDGLSVDEPTTVGPCRVMPFAAIADELCEMTDDEEMIGSFERAPCVAIALASGARMLDAESAGLTEIDHVLAWIAVGLRYGLTHWPDGTARPFDRTSFRALPQRRDLVWVRGLINGRQWIRSTGPTASRPRLDVRLQHLGEPPQGLSVQDRQAIESLRRAAAASNPIQAITALWDAIEFYVAGTSGPRPFADAELKALREAVPKDLPPALRSRAVDSINRLNQLPLLSRLRAAVDADGVPTDDDEWSLLQRLRRSRNALVHGAGVESVSSQREILRGVAFVARLLVFRAHRVSEAS
jgi:hypothetical protein